MTKMTVIIMDRGRTCWPRRSPAPAPRRSGAESEEQDLENCHGPKQDFRVASWGLARGAAVIVPDGQVRRAGGLAVQGLGLRADVKAARGLSPTDPHVFGNHLPLLAET